MLSRCVRVYPIPGVSLGYVGATNHESPRNASTRLHASSINTGINL